MTKEYLDKLSDLINKIYPTKLRNIELIIKHFFSGAAVYANGKICITLTPIGLAIKLPKEYLIKLLKEEGVKSLRYFPKAPIKKEYVVLSESKLRDLEKLKSLINISIRYVTDQ